MHMVQLLLSENLSIIIYDEYDLSTWFFPLGQGLWSFYKILILFDSNLNTEIPGFPDGV